MSFAKKRLRPRLLVLYALALLLLAAASPTPVTLALGLVPIALGAALRAWATGHLHKTEELTTSGPYAYLRHPLYLGILLIASGFALMAWSGVGFAVFAVLVAFYFGYYMPYKNRIEGARLEARFGDTFRRYAVAVPEVLPRIQPYRPLAGDGSSVVAWRSDRFADNNELGTLLVVSAGALAMVVRWALG